MTRYHHRISTFRDHTPLAEMFDALFRRRTDRPLVGADQTAPRGSEAKHSCFALARERRRMAALVGTGLRCAPSARNRLSIPATTASPYNGPERE
jgi:hypothetical protein